MEENRSMIGTQNPTEYQLTEKESLLLEIMLNPEYRTKTISEWCRLANCSRSTYYDAFKKPEFAALYEQKTKDLVRQSIGPVINAVVREAIRGSYNHAKIILEMAGLYTDKIDVTGEITYTASAEERRSRLIEILSKKQLDAAIPVEYSPSHITKDKQDTDNEDD